MYPINGVRHFFPPPPLFSRFFSPYLPFPSLLPILTHTPKRLPHRLVVHRPHPRRPVLRSVLVRGGEIGAGEGGRGRGGVEAVDGVGEGGGAPAGEVSGCIFISLRCCGGKGRKGDEREREREMADGGSYYARG